MGKIKSLILTSISFCILSSCEGTDELDSYMDVFTIVNNTQHKVNIDSQPLSHEVYNNRKVFELQPQDSVSIKGVEAAYGFEPFDLGNVFVIFDDSIKYLCHKSDSQTEMVMKRDNYDLIKKDNDTYFYRYVITEEDYEYAKAHPYSEEN